MNKDLIERSRLYKLQKEIERILSDENIVYCYSKKNGWYERPNNCGYTEYMYQAGVFPKEQACKWAMDSHGDLDTYPVDIEKHNACIKGKIKELLGNIIC